LAVGRGGGDVSERGRLGARKSILDHQTLEVVGEGLLGRRGSAFDEDPVGEGGDDGVRDGRDGPANLGDG